MMADEESDVDDEEDDDDVDDARRRGDPHDPSGAPNQGTLNSTFKQINWNQLEFIEIAFKIMT